MYKTFPALTIGILCCISKIVYAARWWDEPEPGQIPDIPKGPENLLVFALIAGTIFIHDFIETHCEYIKSYNWFISFVIGLIVTTALPLIIGEVIGALALVAGIVLYIPAILRFLSPWIFAGCFFIGFMGILNGDTKIIITSVAVASLLYGLLKISAHIHKSNEDEE